MPAAGGAGAAAAVDSAAVEARASLLKKHGLSEVKEEDAKSETFSFSALRSVS